MVVEGLPELVEVAAVGAEGGEGSRGEVGVGRCGQWVGGGVERKVEFSFFFGFAIRSRSEIDGERRRLGAD